MLAHSPVTTGKFVHIGFGFGAAKVMWPAPGLKLNQNSRSNALHTAASHSTRPFTANGSSFADTCPLCAHCSPNLPPRDTPGHCLGSCCHPQLKSSYIARHNRSLCLIQKTLSACSPTAWFTIMDASSSTRLPPGVASTRLPTWLLPYLPPSSLDKLRPDMLIFRGLSLTRFSSISRGESPPSFPTMILPPSPTSRPPASCTLLS